MVSIHSRSFILAGSPGEGRALSLVSFVAAAESNDRCVPMDGSDPFQSSLHLLFFLLKFPSAGHLSMVQRTGRGEQAFISIVEDEKSNAVVSLSLSLDPDGRAERYRPLISQEREEKK